MPLIGVGDHGRRAVVLVAHHAAREMLAGELPALEIERIAVAVVRGCAEHADAAVVLRPSHLPIVRNVAPHQIAPLRAPRRPFGPQQPGIQPLDRRIRLREAVEARVDRDDVGVPEIGGRCAPRAEVARRSGDGARRRHGCGLCRRRACSGDHRSGAGRQRLDQRSPRQCLVVIQRLPVCHEYLPLNLTAGWSGTGADFCAIRTLWQWACWKDQASTNSGPRRPSAGSAGHRSNNSPHSGE